MSTDAAMPTVSSALPTCLSGLSYTTKQLALLATSCVKRSHALDGAPPRPRAPRRLRYRRARLPTPVLRALRRRRRRRPAHPHALRVPLILGGRWIRSAMQAMEAKTTSLKAMPGWTVTKAKEVSVIAMGKWARVAVFEGKKVKAQAGLFMRRALWDIMLCTIFRDISHWMLFRSHVLRLLLSQGTFQWNAYDCTFKELCTVKWLFDATVTASMKLCSQTNQTDPIAAVDVVDAHYCEPLGLFSGEAG